MTELERSLADYPVPETRYAVHPGPVRPKNDGDEHWIGAARLADLYELRPGEWFSWDDPKSRAGRVWEDYVHLFPDHDGRYGRPDVPR